MLFRFDRQVNVAVPPCDDCCSVFVCSLGDCFFLAKFKGCGCNLLKLQCLHNMISNCGTNLTYVSGVRCVCLWFGLVVSCSPLFALDCWYWCLKFPPLTSLVLNCLNSKFIYCDSSPTKDLAKWNISGFSWRFSWWRCVWFTRKSHQPP